MKKTREQIAKELLIIRYPELDKENRKTGRSIYVWDRMGSDHQEIFLELADWHISQMKPVVSALWTIAIDYHEDNPDRHINPVNADEVASECLIQIGEMERER